MLSFNYTLDSELTAPVGQLPSGIQTQAFGMALSRLARRYRTTREMLLKQVPGTGASALMGATVPWQERLKTEMGFFDAVPDKLTAVAQNVAIGDVGNAVYQGRLANRWNNWAPRALSEYASALGAFERDVSKAMSNAPVVGIPAPIMRLAKIAKMKTPSVPNAKTLGYVDSGINDPAYMAGLDANLGVEPAPLVFGAIAGASLVGLAAWYFSRGGQATANIGGLSGCWKDGLSGCWKTKRSSGMGGGGGQCIRWKRVRSKYGGTVRRCARYL
jgi:hypothetical protein